MDIQRGNLALNTQRVLDQADTLAAQGIWLAVFPECALSGYCFDSLESVRQAAIDQDSPYLARIRAKAKQANIHLVVGFLERVGPDVYNSCGLATPNGQFHIYRKVHLPYLGADRFTKSSDLPLQVFEVDGVRIGMNICYDCSFPESARLLALAGADLIVLPTNWPPGARLTAKHLPNARALENRVYYVAASRVGTEEKVKFIGTSQIIDPNGNELCVADETSETVIQSTIDISIARKKRLVIIPGEYELDRFGDRHPDRYRKLSE